MPVRQLASREVPHGHNAETKASIDPIKLTREHLGEIEKIWVGFAKAKLEPYLEKSRAWMKRPRKENRRLRRPEGVAQRFVATSGAAASSRACAK